MSIISSYALKHQHFLSLYSSHCLVASSIYKSFSNIIQILKYTYTAKSLLTDIWSAKGLASYHTILYFDDPKIKMVSRL